MLQRDKKLHRIAQRAQKIFDRTKQSLQAAVIKRPYLRYVIPAAALMILLALALLLIPGKDGADRSTAAAESAAETPVIPTSTPSPSPVPTLPPTPTPDITLKQGVEDSERVSELQLRLMNLGYMDTDEPTQHFGPVTKHSVELFQRQHELQQDGIAGVQTLDLIFSSEAKKYTLLEGTSGDDVESFQSQLKDLGYLSKVTGYYGDETLKAVKAFQKNNELKEDGKAGQQTIDLINSDKAKQSPHLVKEKRRKANIDKVISIAGSKMGSRYRSGHTGPDTFDCSGLVYYCLKQAGSNRRRLTAAGYSQVEDWEKISSMSKLKKGDLLFFLSNDRKKVGHVGIYIGGGEMIDASSSNGKVVRRAISGNYWKTHFVHARRPW